MIEEKTQEWQKQILVMDSELQSKGRENTKLQQHLDTSQKEVQVLQKQLENEKKQNAMVMNQYGVEMEKLKDEVNKLKNKFNKKNQKKPNTKTPEEDDNADGDVASECNKEPQRASASSHNLTNEEDCNNPDDCCIHKDGANLDARCTDINLIEKSLHNLTSCLRETTSCLDKKVCELQMCHAQLESFYFENSILRSFLHQRGILNSSTTPRENLGLRGDTSFGNAAATSVSDFSTRERDREQVLREKIRSTIDDFIRNTGSPPSPTGEL